MSNFHPSCCSSVLELTIPCGLGRPHRDPGACCQAQSPLGFLGLSLHSLPFLGAAPEGTFQLKLNHIPPSLPDKDGISDSSCDTTGSSGSSWSPKEGPRGGN